MNFIKKISSVLRTTLLKCLLLVGIAFSVGAEPDLTIYDLNKHVSTAESNVTAAVRLNEDIYYIQSEYNMPQTLWRYEQNSQTTHLVPYPFPENRTPAQLTGLTRFNDEILFSGRLVYSEYDYADYKRQWLWRYQPDAEQAELVSLPDVSDSNPNIRMLTEVGDALYFVANGTEDEVLLMRYDSECMCAETISDTFTGISHMLAFQDRLIIAGMTERRGQELWYLSTEDKVALVGDFNKGTSSSWPNNFTLDEHYLYFVATNQYKLRKLWRYSVVNNQLKQLTEINNNLYQPGIKYHPEIVSQSEDFMAIEFLGPNAQVLDGQLWLFDKRDDSAVKVANINHYWGCDDDGWIGNYTPIATTFKDNKLIYIANEELQGDHIWQFDLNSRQKANLTSGIFDDTSVETWCGPQYVFGSQLVTSDHHLYFFIRIRSDAHPEGGPVELWRLDLSTADNEDVMAESLHPGPDSLPGFGTYPAGYTFSVDRALWLIDSSSDQVMPAINVNNQQLLDFQVLSTSEDTLYSARINREAGWQLWQLSDSGITEKLSNTEKKVISGRTGSHPSPGVILNDKMYFVANSGIANRSLWYVGETGVPLLLPAIADNELTNLRTELAIGGNLYLSSLSESHIKRLYYRFDPQKNKLTELNEVNNSASSTVDIYDWYNNEITFISREGGTIKVIVYNTDTEQTSLKYDGDGNVAYVDKQSIYLFRYIDYYNGLWHYDIASQELTQIETTQIRDCFTQPFGDDAVAVGNNVYIRRTGSLMRHNRDTGEFDRFDCVTRMHSVADELLIFDNSDISGRGLYRITSENKERELITPLHFTSDAVHQEGNKVYFNARGVDEETGLWEYDYHTGQAQLISERPGDDIHRIEVIADELYIQIDSHLYKANDADPILNLAPLSAYSWQYPTWWQFAGDLWLSGTLEKNNLLLTNELVRVHLNSDKIAKASPLDFDGDGKADIALRDKEQHLWTIYNSSDEQVYDTQFGLQETDIPVSADYDGDGIIDIAVRRPSSNMWYVINSSNSNYNSDRGDGIQRIRFGLSTDDIPVPADYDGDGIADLAVRRPSFGGWIIHYSATDEISQLRFGNRQSDVPVVGDFDGDGKADLAFRRLENKTWYVKNSSGANFNSERQDGIQRIVLGQAEEDVPVPADYDGDGITDMAVWRPSVATFIIRSSRTRQISEKAFDEDIAGLPVPADYNGDGIADTALYFPDSGLMRIRYSQVNIADQVQDYQLESDLLPVGLPINELSKTLLQ